MRAGRGIIKMWAGRRIRKMRAGGWKVRVRGMRRRAGWGMRRRRAK